MVDPKTGVVLARLYPLDKHRNANGRRATRVALVAAEPILPTGMAPLLAQLIAEVIRDRFSIPIIFLTALVSDSIINQANVTERVGYIIKPFDEWELRTVIEMALGKHRTASATAPH